MKSGIESLSAFFAVMAAVFWFMSARIKTPNNFSVHVITTYGGMGSGHSPELNELAVALQKQSRLSAWAAFFAGISAMLQALLVIVPS